MSLSKGEWQKFTVQGVAGDKITVEVQGTVRRQTLDPFYQRRMPSLPENVPVFARLKKFFRVLLP